MKVLLINGSPHTNGCTATALAEMARLFEQENTEAQEAKSEEAEQEETPESAPAEDKTAELEKALAAEKEKLLRTAAEYANFRTRTEREKAAIYSNAVSDTVKELIPIADIDGDNLITANDALSVLRQSAGL